MDTYSKIAAAELLGVTRQTVHRHVKKNPGRYTMTTDAGEQVITLRGLEELRAVLHGTTKRYTPDVTTMQQDVTGGASTLRQELEQERKRTLAALDDVTRLNMDVTSLQLQLDKANTSIEELKADKALLFEALKDAQRKIPDAKPGFIQTIKRLMPWNKG
jgi:predicted transcriptional regulator